jgi:hypothetical protein
MVHNNDGEGMIRGMAFMGTLAQRRAHPRVITMSRFRYLRIPMPADASPAAQANL